MHSRIRRLVTGLSLLAALALPPLLGGCGSWASGGGRGDKSQVADYNGLSEKSVAVVVYADQANTDEFPGAREEISAFVTNEMQLHMPTVRLLNYKEVLNWQDDTLNWFGLSEQEIGKHFSVDRVLFIEVLSYESRADQSYGDLQGHLRANCKVYEVDAAGGVPAWTALIDVTWPELRPVPASQGNEVAVRRRTLDNFAIKLVDHFYDHGNTDIPLRNR